MSRVSRAWASLDRARSPCDVRPRNVGSRPGTPIVKDRAALVALGLTAAYVAFGLVAFRAARGLGVPSNDFYGMFYPTFLHARESIAAGGAGLLWNPYQACGEPFLADMQVGLFYPVNLVFFLLPREAAAQVSILLNLVVAGVGAWGLARALGVGRAAALSAAIAFQMGGLTIQLATWSPIHIGTYVWMAAALWMTERLVQRPGIRRALALGVVLTVQVLPGYLPVVFFTCQVVALRVLWALVTRESSRPPTLVAGGVAALLLPWLLGAVQLLPAVAMAAASVRTRPLPAWQIGQGANPFRGIGSLPDGYLAAAAAAVALVSLARPGRRRVVTFYLLVAVAYVCLSLGPGTPLFDLYARLPLVTAVRFSDRLRWVTSFALAVLVGFAADALPGPPRVRSVVPLLVFANALWVVRAPIFGLRRGDVYGPHAEAFALVRERATLQDRVAVVGRFTDFSLCAKTPTVFRVRGIFDYQTQASARYADYFTYMRLGRTLRDVDDWFWTPYASMLPATLRRPLFDLTATRYLVVDPELDTVAAALPVGVRLLAETTGVRVYENAEALPRARFVPSVAVVPQADALAMLAAPTHDARRTALVEEAPAAAGGPTDARATVAITADTGERVVVDVDATAAGFLVLADQYADGWTATVNGERRDVARADYAFRLVAVPAGRSEVVFAYRPWTLRLGLLVSSASLIAVAVVGVRRGRR